MSKVIHFKHQLDQGTEAVAAEFGHPARGDADRERNLIGGAFAHYNRYCRTDLNKATALTDILGIRVTPMVAMPDNN